jgi:hypothetical protein
MEHQYRKGFGISSGFGSAAVGEMDTLLTHVFSNFKYLYFIILLF